jgi:2-aminoethylphosphonate-pyruvate transaminase
VRCGEAPRDWCTWDRDYNDFVQGLRARLLSLLGPKAVAEYSTRPMQGPGTFAIEAALTSLLPREGKLLPPDPDELGEILVDDTGISHVRAVHVETTMAFKACPASASP